MPVWVPSASASSRGSQASMASPVTLEIRAGIPEPIPGPAVELSSWLPRSSSTWSRERCPGRGIAPSAVGLLGVNPCRHQKESEGMGENSAAGQHENTPHAMAPRQHGPKRNEGLLHSVRTIREKVPRSLRLSVRVALAMSFLTAGPRPVRAGYDWLRATRRSCPSHLPRLRSAQPQSWSPALRPAAPARPDPAQEQHHDLSCGRPPNCWPCQDSVILSAMRAPPWRVVNST